MKKSIVLLLAMIIVLSLCACSGGNPEIQALESDDDIIAIQEKFDIDISFKSVGEDNQYDTVYPYVIISNKFADLTDDEKIEVFLAIDGLQYEYNGETHELERAFFESYVIISGESEYIVLYGAVYDEYHKLYKDGYLLHSMLNEDFDQVEADASEKREQEYYEYVEENRREISGDGTTNETNSYEKDYDNDYSDNSGYSDIDTNTCGSCGRKYNAGDSGGNYMNIARTGMCKSCYNSYKSMSGY